MSKTIRITAELYNRLERHAEGFDTPANVIERILDAYEGIPNQNHYSSSNHMKGNKRDSTKYLFNGSRYGKGRLVLALVMKYVSDNPTADSNHLLSVFPKEIQGSIGVFNKYDYVKEKYSEKQHKRHFVKPEEVIQLSDCKVVVSTEWGVGNINNILNKAQELGYEVTPVE